MLRLKLEIYRVANFRHEWIQGFEWCLKDGISPHFSVWFALCWLHLCQAFLMSLQARTPSAEGVSFSFPMAPAEVLELNKPRVGCVPSLVQSPQRGHRTHW